MPIIMELARSGLPQLMAKIGELMCGRYKNKIVMRIGDDYKRIAVDTSCSETAFLAIAKYVSEKSTPTSSLYVDKSSNKKETVIHPLTGKYVSYTQRESYLIPKSSVYIDGYKITINETENKDKKDNKTVEHSITIESNNSASTIRKHIDSLLTEYMIFKAAHKPMYQVITMPDIAPRIHSSHIEFTSSSDMYHPHKKQITQLLTQYHAQPDRMILLLSGPPGSGKSSIIKIIARHTNYHLLEIDLNSIDDGCFRSAIYNDGGLCVSNNPGIIYVMEDIDAMSDNVLTRENKASRNKDKKAQQESSDSTASVISLKKDVTLSTLLNAFDGIRELPKSIIVMTTNYPERIDPALIRPGRITKHITVSALTAKQCNKLVRSYYSGADTGALRFVDGEFMISTLGQICKNSMGNYDAFLEMLSATRASAGK